MSTGLTLAWQIFPRAINKEAAKKRFRRRLKTVNEKTGSFQTVGREGAREIFGLPPPHTDKDSHRLVLPNSQVAQRVFRISGFQ
jgi:hypothetical protein